MEKIFYNLVPSRFGPLGLVWWEGEAGPRVRQIFLPRAGTAMEEVIRKAYGAIPSGACPPVSELVERMRRFLAGEAVEFSLDLLDLEICPAFQRRVLTAEFQIPRGWVSTYGQVARHLGIPGGARAAGGALAANPFPIVIPCHRAVRSGGDLGGFQGGLPMKRALLEMEGVAFSANGRVVMERVYY